MVSGLRVCDPDLRAPGGLRIDTGETRLANLTEEAPRGALEP